MSIFSELRYPTTPLSKALSGILAFLLFAVFGITVVAGFLLRQVLKPSRNPATIDLNVMMGHPSTFSFPVEGGEREGWFFPGLQGAPTIIVCHGYGSQRGDVLTLVTALQDQQYNVFLFDFAGHGSSPGNTTLGYRETDELRSAINALAGRPDVDPKRFGLWGVDLGAYAALEAAEADPRITAVAVDSVYDDPADLLQYLVKKTGLSILPFVTRFCEIGFHLVNYQYRQEPPVSAHVGRLQGTSKLFIQSQDRPYFAIATGQLYQRSPDPKRMEVVRVSYTQMSDDDRKTYENMIVSFFLLSLPAAGHAAH
jgi:pimeloyl-ACP methyl ester carboxylesterase